MDFNSEQKLAMTKSIIKLTKPSRSFGHVENRSRRISKFEDGVVVFYDNEQHNLPNTHNQPLYVTANMKGVELKRGMLDPGFSLNIISLSVLDPQVIPRDRITRQPIEVASFRGHII